MRLPKANVTFKVATTAAADSTVAISLTTDAVALYVILTTRAHGRFSDNAFALLPGTTTVHFVPFGKLDLPTLTASLRLEHLEPHQTPILT